jgi:hypothetical protein
VASGHGRHRIEDLADNTNRQKKCFEEFEYRVAWRIRVMCGRQASATLAFEMNADFLSRTKRRGLS